MSHFRIAPLGNGLIDRIQKAVVFQIVDPMAFATNDVMVMTMIVRKLVPGDAVSEIAAPRQTNFFELREAAIYRHQIAGHGLHEFLKLIHRERSMPL